MMNRRTMLTVTAAGAAAAVSGAAHAAAQPRLSHFFPSGSPQKLKVGLVGGTGPDSTLDYYKRITYGTQEKYGKPFYPNLAIESISVHTVFSLFSAKDFKGLAAYFTEAVKRLAGAGCDVASFTGITPHVIFDDVAAASPIPLVSLITPTAEAAKARKMKKLALLATQFTMTSDFFLKPFREAGIEIIRPDASQIAYVADKMNNEIEMGIIKPETQAKFRDIVSGMKKEGAEALIFGCTELPGFFKGVDLPLAGLDPMDLHIEKLIRLMLNGN